MGCCARKSVSGRGGRGSSDSLKRTGLPGFYFFQLSPQSPVGGDERLFARVGCVSAGCWVAGAREGLDLQYLQCSSVPCLSSGVVDGIFKDKMGHCFYSV